MEPSAIDCDSATVQRLNDTDRRGLRRAFLSVVSIISLWQHKAVLSRRKPGLHPRFQAWSQHGCGSSNPWGSSLRGDHVGPRCEYRLRSSQRHGRIEGGLQRAVFNGHYLPFLESWKSLRKDFCLIQVTAVCLVLTFSSVLFEISTFLPQSVVLHLLSTFSFLLPSAVSVLLCILPHQPCRPMFYSCSYCWHIWKMKVTEQGNVAQSSVQSAWPGVKAKN